MRQRLKGYISNIRYNIVKNKFLQFFCALLLAIFPSVIRTSFARYVFDEVNDRYLLSREFYFESPQLLSNSYTLSDWDGISNYIIPLEIRNYSDELRWTSDNINYEVEISCDSSISGSVTCESSNGTIMSSNTATTNNVLITLKNTSSLNFKDGDYIDMDISVKSTSPYEKELDATFKINVKTKKVIYEIKDETNREYAELIISNNTLNNKNISVSWDYNVFSIDNLDKIIANATIGTYVNNNVSYINSFNATIRSKSSYKIRFYKKNKTQNYTYPSGNSNSVINVVEN